MLDKNENIHSDMVDILNHVHKYVRKDGGHIIEKSIFGGDLLTCERALNAQQDMQDAPTSLKRLEGLIPVIEDFHTFGNFLSVSTCKEFACFVTK